MMLQFFLSESTVSVLTQVVLHFLWQGALLGLSAGCLLQVLPIHTASARYVFYCGLLALLAICPLVTWCGISAGSVAAIEVQTHSANEVGGGDAVADAEVSATDSNIVRSKVVQSTIQPPDSRLHVAGAWLDRQRWLIVTAWLTGICFMATRLLLGAIGLWTLAWRRQPIPPKVAHMVDRLSLQLTFRVRPAVYVVERISQAMAMGIFKSMVLLPASWISELPSDVLEAVIAHELAHLRRWDLVVNLLQRVVETVLFFHPAVWWCSRRLRIEREMCCDELAQAAVGNRVVYAKALAYLAHQQSSSVEFLLAAGIGGKKMVLLDRIYNVLGMMPGRHGRLYGPSCALVGAALTSLVWIAVFGLPAQLQSRTSNEGIVSQSARSRSSEAAKTTLPTDSIDQSTPLDKVTQDSELLTLENLKFTSYWDLSLEEAIKSSKANAKAMRSLGGHQVSPTCNNCSQTGEAQQTPTSNVELSLADFERGVRNLVNDTQNAYWELAFAWRNLETSNTALDSARQTWKKIHLIYVAGTKDGDAKNEAHAREQYFQFKSTAQTLLNELFRAENRLRYVMGISPADGRLIRPIDQPTVAKVNFDWREITEEALAHSPELRRQKWRIKQREMELIAAKNVLQPRLDLNGTYRWLGLGDKLQAQEASTSNVDKPLSLTGSSVAEMFDSGQFQEWALGLQATVPIEFRKELATVRNYQLKLARERARLQDEQLEVSHQLAAAMRQLELNYQLTQTNFNRSLAAERQVEAVQAAFEAETVTLDQLLEAQRRRAEAQTSYFRTLLDYQRAIVAVHYRKGSLL
jgi:beta-lactamase regulating signal transducer with metallopeptidase domain/outer membrane protein TolC